MFIEKNRPLKKTFSPTPLEVEWWMFVNSYLLII
jgi:hypothetical protein